MHPTRRERLTDLIALDPATEFEEIYRRSVLWEFPTEARLGFQLAFYRPMASPRIARILVQTGHFLRDTTKRAYDSGIVIHELIASGIDSDRGRRMIALMNKLHDRPGIEQEDLTYVLLALLLEPVNLISRYSFRPLHPHEIQAAHAFYTTVGQRMGIHDLPASYDSARAWFAAYEKQHTAHSPEADQLTTALVGALADRMPTPVRGRAGQIMATLLDDPAAAAALGLPRPDPLTRTLTRAAMTARRLRQRRSPAPAEPSFTPGQAVRHAYPDGYRLSQIGPSSNSDQ